MPNQSGVVSPGATITLTVTVNDRVTVSPRTGVFAAEYPLGVSLVSGWGAPFSYDCNVAGSFKITAGAGATLDYRVIDVPDEQGSTIPPALQALVSGDGMIGQVAMSGVPTAGQVPVASDGTHAAWGDVAGSGGGSVSSVAVTVPGFLAVTGSPITSSGTLAISYSGTPLPVANGGTGTSAPGLVAGSNVTVSGSWPNQTIAASGSGGSAGQVVYLSDTVTSDASGQLGYGGTAPTGTDQTAAVQAAVDSVPVGGKLVWDVAVGLSAPIYYPSNLTVEAPSPACGAILRAAANCPMFRLNGMQTAPANNTSTASQNWFGKQDPAHSGDPAYRVWNRTFVNARNLKISGGTWNGNKSGQTSAPFTATYGFLAMFQFYGIDGLILEDVTIRNSKGTLPFHIANWNNVVLRNVEVDQSPITTNLSAPGVLEACLQINGPGQRLRIYSPTTHSTDDHIALNPDDSTSGAINGGYGGGSSPCVAGVNWVQCGDITNVRVYDWKISDGIEGVRSLSGFRILSTAHKCHDVKVINSSGTTSKVGHTLGPWPQIQCAGPGDLDDISFIGSTVEVTDLLNTTYGIGVFDIRGSFGTIRILDRKRGNIPTGGVADVVVWDSESHGATNGRQLVLSGEYYDDGTGSNAAAEQIRVAAPVEHISVRTNQSRDASVPAVASPVLKIVGDASIGIFDWHGELNRATNVVSYEGGAVNTIRLSGAHRNGGGGSPIAVSSGRTLTNYWYKDLAYAALDVNAKSGAGTVTNDNAYAETAVTAYVLDTFTAADSTALNGRTPSPTTAGNNWTTLEGAGAQQTIQSNVARLVAGAAVQSLTVDTGQASGTVTVSAALGATGATGCGIMFRMTDANNYWLLWIDGANRVDVYKVVANVSTTRANIVIASNTAAHDLRVVLSGHSIVATYGGVSVANLTDSFNATATKHGMRAYANTATFDNFQMTA